MAADIKVEFKIEINGKEIILTSDEAKTLKMILCDMFKENVIPHTPFPTLYRDITNFPTFTKDNTGKPSLDLVSKIKITSITE